MAKSKTDKVNKNNEFTEDDIDIEQDMKTLGQVRDELLRVFKDTADVNLKLNIASVINSVIQTRENSEMFLLRISGFNGGDEDEDEYCEGCPECEAINKQNDPTDSN